MQVEALLALIIFHLGLVLVPPDSPSLIMAARFVVLNSDPDIGDYTWCEPWAKGRHGTKTTCVMRVSILFCSVLIGATDVSYPSR